MLTINDLNRNEALSAASMTEIAGGEDAYTIASNAAKNTMRLGSSLTTTVEAIAIVAWNILTTK
jgi:hypothetical protein